MEGYDAIHENIEQGIVFKGTNLWIYDVIIALFGGLAGIVAMSSRLKGNVIPGVAIATALMPPICTAGYGLATLQFNFFFGAIYLFTINTVFIAFAALIVCQLLRFPIRSIVDPARKKHVNRVLSAIILLTLIPSIFFGVNLVKNEEFSQHAESFISEVTLLGGNYLQNKQINPAGRTIELVYSGYGLADSAITGIWEKALNYRLDTSRIEIRQGFDANLMQENVRKYQSESERLNNQLAATVFTLRQTEGRVDSIRNIPFFGEKILGEIKPLYPQIQSCSYSETYLFTTINDSIRRSEMMPVVIFIVPRNGLRISDRSKIEEWLKSRLHNSRAKMVIEEI